MKTLCIVLVAALCLQDSAIKRLGDSNPEERDRARKELLKQGEAARSALQDALKSADPEIASRAKLILGLLDENLAAASSYFPVGDGFHWVYATTTGVDRELRVGKRTPIEYGQEKAEAWSYKSFDDHHPSWMPQEDYLVALKGGIRIVGSGDVGEVRHGANTLDTLADLKWEGEATWSFESDCGCYGAKVEGTRMAEKITVPAGTFECVKITLKSNVAWIAGRGRVMHFWLARGVGLVKHQSDATTWELKSYRTRHE